MAYVSSTPTQRQLKRLKGILLTELHFLVEWVEDDAHSIVSSKQVNHDTPMSLSCGDVVDVRIQDHTYQATIVGVGTKSEMEELQSQYSDSEKETLDSGSEEAPESTLSKMSTDDAMMSEMAPEDSDSHGKILVEKSTSGETSSEEKELTEDQQSSQLDGSLAMDSEEGHGTSPKSTSKKQKTPSRGKRPSPTKPPAPKRSAPNNSKKSPAKGTKKKRASPTKKKSPAKRSPAKHKAPSDKRPAGSKGGGTGAKGSKARVGEEHLEAKSAHKEALEKKRTKEREKQSYLVESSSEILTQLDKKSEATNHAGDLSSGEEHPEAESTHKEALEKKKKKTKGKEKESLLVGSSSKTLTQAEQIAKEAQDVDTNFMYTVDDDGFTPDDFRFQANDEPQFTPPSRIPLRKSHSDPTNFKSCGRPNVFSPEYTSGYSPLSQIPAPYPSVRFPFMYSRSPTPVSDHSSSYLSSSYGYGHEQPEIMSTLRSLRDDFNKLAGEVESLKSEVRKKARKPSKDKGIKSPQELIPGGVEGCWFGVKGDDKLGVFIPGVKQCDLSAVDVCTNAENLSQDLLELLFSKEEMAQGCSTKPRRGDIQKLDNKRLHAIRVHLSHRFPTGPLYGPDESKRWKDIKGKKINVRCRQYRPSKPQETS